MSEGGLISTLSERPSEGGPGWLAQLRRDAAARLREGGFPGKKHEKWRFTSVRDVVDTAFRPSERGDLDAVMKWVGDRLGDDDGTFRVVLADGAPMLATSAPKGVRVASLRDALTSEAALLEPVLGKVAPAEHFAALNAAMFSDGVLVVIEAGAVLERPLSLVHVARASEAPAAAYPRVVVIAEAGSQATLIETFLVQEGERHLTNAVGEIVVGDGARLDHTRLVLGADRAFHIANLAVRQERGSFYASRAITLGGALSRLDLDVLLAGEGAETVLDGVYHVDRSEHVDHQVFVDHAAPHGSSHARYRGLLDGKGHAVVNIMGIVRKTAPGTSAHQENRNLLLSDDATIDTKPHLEIETDDVKASHGATIGAVDETSLFYLRSRGVPEAVARDVLTFAFVRELIERIPHAPTAAQASDAVLARLPSGERIRELFE